MAETKPKPDDDRAADPAPAGPPVETATAAPGEKRSTRRGFAARPADPDPALDPSRFAASSDPAVHALLAQREAHVMNLDALTKPADPDAVRAAEDAIADVDRKLAEL